MMVCFEILPYILKQQRGFPDAPTPVDADEPVIPVNGFNEISNQPDRCLSVLFVKSLDENFHINIINALMQK